MNPADRLIVALDLPVDDAFNLVRQLRYQANNFKLGVAAFLSRGGIDLADYLAHEGAGLMLDLKLYDTRDTVQRTMDVAEKIGAHWVTVHADCAAHARGFGPKILIVRRLTDGTGAGAVPSTRSGFSNYDESICDGLVCSVETAKNIRQVTDRILVCPGIRPDLSEPNNHTRPSTPGEAIRAGADYIVVGRPIYAAPDPVKAARAITLEIEAAEKTPPS